MIVLRNKRYRLGQKEYGIIGNVRKYLVKKLDKGIIDRYQAFKEAQRIARVRKPAIVDTSMENRLATVSKQESMPVLNLSAYNKTDPTNYTVKKLETSDLADLYGSSEEILRGIKLVGKPVIIHPAQSGTERLAHEYGHVSNSVSRNPVVRYIEDKANSDASKTREGISISTNNLDTKGNEPVYGLRNAIRRFINSRIVLNEETRANKKGMRFLKRAGASPESLKTAKENLSQGIETYRNSGSLYWRIPLRNSIAVLKRDKNGNPIFDRIVNSKGN